MPKYLLHFFLFIILLFYTTTSIQAQAQTEIIMDTLMVGTAGSEPFVFDGEDKGIAIEIWDKIALNKSWNYKYVHFENVDDALHALMQGHLDLVVGPISITSSRIEHMKFSQPFYNSSISILSPIQKNNFWQKIKPFFSFKLLIALFIFLIILAGVGTLFWIAERKKSPDQFAKDPLHGIGTGMWLAIVTMSTTGYGDKAPVTLAGRIIAGAWMVITIIFATSMVAGIASTLTLSSLGGTTISNIEQLSGKKVATIDGSSTEELLNKSKIHSVGVNDFAEAITKLKNKEVDAVVYDRPQLLYYLKNNKDEDLYISKAEYYKQGYGFAFPLNSLLISDVNQALLELAENQEIEKIVHYYIQKDE
ncbi:MAG: transporter substrate-binding domain-containing protein [Chitinophagales bacterium]|nr:transporter substrate-binding domain-containing protein [Chitinophagales bacterium]MBP9548802.1 transporter substrate-binding domain-containing protein [Chitinophagales bacterium]MBP9703322.1 transporter substrate-binding domain-containing protein [Chitinophagales bacterium]